MKNPVWLIHTGVFILGWFFFRFLSKEFHYFEKIYFHITSRSLIRIFSRFRHRINRCINSCYTSCL